MKRGQCGSIYFIGRNAPLRYGPSFRIRLFGPLVQTVPPKTRRKRRRTSGGRSPDELDLGLGGGTGAANFVLIAGARQLSH